MQPHRWWPYFPLLFCFYAQDLFTPIILSVLIAYAANPLVAAIEAIRIPRAFAALLVVFTLVFGVGFGAYVLRNQANVVLQTLPTLVSAQKPHSRMVDRRWPWLLPEFPTSGGCHCCDPPRGSEEFRYIPGS